jgi:hypothetical protein
MRSSSKKITLAGAVAQRPGQGGHTWVFLQYLLGLQRLGWDTLLIDRLEPDMCVDEHGSPCALEDSTSIAYVDRVLSEFGLGGNYALLYDGARTVRGMTRERMLEHVRDSVAIIDVMGYLDTPEVLDAARRRVFLDIDPGFSHMWQDLGWATLFDGYDSFVTVAGNIGREGCTIPTCDRTWIPTLQPIVLHHWPPAPAPDLLRFSSVGAWRGPYGPVEYRGETYGLRVHEFRKFITLPVRTGEQFELALDIHEAEQADRTSLEENRWRLVDPREVARDPWAYRQYVQSSAAEFMVAKNMYVATGSGWFSDRSVCYLASGRPVLAQDTGLDAVVPSGSGLVTFSTLEEAAAGVEMIAGDYARHARAARELAEACFDSDRVLSSLLDRLGIDT